MSYVYYVLHRLERHLFKPFNRACERFLESQDYDTED